MLDDILGAVGWPAAVAIFAIVAGITTYNVNESNQEGKVRTACIAQHGEVVRQAGGFGCVFK